MKNLRLIKERKDDAEREMDLRGLGSAIDHDLSPLPLLRFESKHSSLDELVQAFGGEKVDHHSEDGKVTIQISSQNLSYKEKTIFLFGLSLAAHRTFQLNSVLFEVQRIGDFILTAAKEGLHHSKMDVPSSDSILLSPHSQLTLQQAGLLSQVNEGFHKMSGSEISENLKHFLPGKIKQFKQGAA